MKKTLFILLLAGLFFSQTTFAQSSNARNGLSYNVSFIDYHSPVINDLYNPDGNTTLGAKVAYHRNLTGNLNLEVPIRLGIAQLATTDADGNVIPSNRRILDGIEALLQYQVPIASSRIIPYLSAGAGAIKVKNEDFDFQVPLGLGLDIRLARNFYLQGRSEYRVSFQDYPEAAIDATRTNLTHHLGVKFLLGEGDEPKPKKDPDTDGDGISDMNDECPTVIGTAALKGCPDTDGDGVADKNDSCPDVAGLAAMAGCPDSDGDGLTDGDDKCPNEAGPKDNEGCPIADADGDGVVDADDKCPNEAGLASNDGCPLADADGDGIADADDECPNEAGTAAMNGCPDSDNDGIKDKDDNCPNEAGKAALKGCPDRDNDNVADKNDRCPDEAGPANNNGCPVKTIKAEDKETLARVAKNIQFESNSSYFKSASLANMDEIASILKQYPGYNVTIEGHTDSAGADDYNQMLSQKRAKRCFEYLVEKGISASRMTHAGYGETRPIATNSTAAGRKENRRVTFDLFPRQQMNDKW